MKTRIIPIKSILKRTQWHYVACKNTQIETHSPPSAHSQIYPYVCKHTCWYLSGYLFLICCLCALSLLPSISISGASSVPQPFIASCIASTSLSQSKLAAGFTVPPFLAAPFGFYYKKYKLKNYNLINVKSLLC
jgi:hypothetical protein